MKDTVQSKAGQIRRTRSGCWNCKARRRKCTEDRPSCSGCVKRGLQCHYGTRLLWQDEAESMGIAFGRAGMKDRFQKIKKKTIAARSSLPARPRAIYYWLNTTFDDVYLLYNALPRKPQVSFEPESRRKESGKYADVSNDLPATLGQFPSLGEIDQFLFHYFSNVCTPRRSLVNNENPWQTVLLPLCFQSPGLLHISIAWAAHDLRNRCKEQDIPQYDEMVLKHKCRSLRYLQHMVPQRSKNSSILAQTKGERDALLLLVMVQCMLEIASGSLIEWTFHMKGALHIMKFYTGLNGTSRQDIFSPQVLELVYSFFAENDTFLATTGDVEDSCSHMQWSTQVQAMFPFLGSLPTKVRPCMGLSPELLDIISSITTLACSRRRPKSKNQGSIIHRDFERLRERIYRLQTLPERIELRGLINLHATAFEEAAWIYLHHAVQDEPLESDTIQKVHLPRLLRILEEIHTMQGSLLGFLPYPMWALFIASCSVQEEERTRILEWFTIIKCNKPISNVPSTMAAVEAIWKRRDLELVELGKASSSSRRPSRYSRTWEAAIAQLGWKMSLI